MPVSLRPLPQPHFSFPIPNLYLQPHVSLVYVLDHICWISNYLRHKSFDLCPTVPLHIPLSVLIRRSLKGRLSTFVIHKQLILSLLNLSLDAKSRYAAYIFSFANHSQSLISTIRDNAV